MLTGEIGWRVASPNGSRPGFPTVQRPKENLCSFFGCRLFIAQSSEKGRANWQFALTPSMRLFGKTRQTASLPYLRGVLFILSVRRHRHEDSSENQPRRNEEHECFSGL